jgi:hypothetical protein
MAAGAKKCLVVSSTRRMRLQGRMTDHHDGVRGTVMAVVRTCINCGDPFESVSPFNRRCYECLKHQANKFITQWGG